MAWQVSGYDCTYAAHRGAPSRNEISILPNAWGTLKINKVRREAPRRNVMENKHTEAASPNGAEVSFPLKKKVSFRRSVSGTNTKANFSQT